MLSLGCTSLTTILTRLPVVLQGKYAEADPLSFLAIDMAERTLGPDHPRLSVLLGIRASLLDKLVRPYRDIKDASRGVVMGALLVAGCPGRVGQD